MVRSSRIAAGGDTARRMENGTSGQGNLNTASPWRQIGEDRHLHRISRFAPKKQTGQNHLTAEGVSPSTASHCYRSAATISIANPQHSRDVLKPEHDGRWGATRQPPAPGVRCANIGTYDAFAGWRRCLRGSPKAIPLRRRSTSAPKATSNPNTSRTGKCWFAGKGGCHHQEFAHENTERRQAGNRDDGQAPNPSQAPDEKPSAP